VYGNMVTKKRRYIRKFEAFEMWVSRKMERISWTEKVTKNGGTCENG